VLPDLGIAKGPLVNPAEETLCSGWSGGKVTLPADQPHYI